MEVHPPEHGIHSWREFFVHMGTIVLGLLIAIALEQSVEALHRRHERADLREALHGESEQIIADARSCDAVLRGQIVAAMQNKDAAFRVLWSGESGESVPAYSTPEALEYPFDPIFRSALATSRVALLTPDETNAYMEITYDMDQIKSSYNEYSDAVHERERFETELPRSASTNHIDLKRLDRPTLQRYVDLFAAEIESSQRLRLDCAQTAKAEEVLASGEMRLNKLYEAEKEGMRSVGSLTPDSKP